MCSCMRRKLGIIDMVLYINKELFKRNVSCYIVLYFLCCHPQLNFLFHNFFHYILNKMRLLHIQFKGILIHIKSSQIPEMEK